MLKRLIAPLLLAVMLVTTPAPSHALTKSPDPFRSVRTRLVEDGFSQERVDLYFQKGTRLFAIRGVSGYFTHNEGTLNYKRFLTPRALATGTRYLRRHGPFLSATEARYGVNKEIITAVLMVETALGTYLGNSRVFEILATLSSLSDTTAKERLWREIPSTRRISRSRFEKKTKDKAQWAYRELKALITYSEGVGKKPTLFIGSYAGAMGIPQFMPSRILQLGVDGNEDGQIDLYTHEDAIASVANYLKHFGWKPGIEKERAIRVLMRYNHSIYYANTLYDIMDALKQTHI